MDVNPAVPCEKRCNPLKQEKQVTCDKGGGFRVITILFSLTWNSHALAIPFKGKCFHNQMHSINYYNHQLLLSVSVSSDIKVEVWGVL